MLDGKKGTAQSIVYSAFDRIKEATGEEPLEVFEKAMNNIMPVFILPASILYILRALSIPDSFFTCKKYSYFFLGGKRSAKKR